MRITFNGMCTKVFCELLQYIDGLDTFSEITSIDSGTYSLEFDIPKQIHFEIDEDKIFMSRKNYDYYLNISREDFAELIIR